jgi:SAM-dependent methyltransferase
MEKIIKSYSDINAHRIIGKLIKKYSENKEDIRETAKKTLNWDRTHTILDLGCGYGWFEDTLHTGFDFILGIDCFNENELEFLKAACRIAKKAIFKHMRLPAPIEMPADYFDLVVSAYSLYFFPEVIPEVKRVLHPEGVFLIVTHSESMLEEGERLFDFKNLRKVIENFSAENGESILRKYFKEVSAVDYFNALVFTKDSGDDLVRYIDFKTEFIARDVSPLLVREKMLGELNARGIAKFNKNDRIFIARK